MSEENYQNLIQLIDNFEINFCFFKQEQIPNNFKKQVFYFIERLNQLTVVKLNFRKSNIKLRTTHKILLKRMLKLLLSQYH
jgi:hypothetical protein